ncbi:MAG: ABC transporter permease [Candidatus Symbiobacter sp.]|nr:ABC transporter permease [Candidatus Symbiobacter sp.]
MKNFVQAIRDAKVTPQNDIIKGMLSYRVWLILAWHETKLKYRRSVIGPLWITLSTAILVGFLGVLYGVLLRQPINEYLPYLAVGLVTWQFISASLTESCDTLINSSIYIRQFNQPVTIYCARYVVRNYIVLLHNIPVALIAIFWFKDFNLINLVLAVLGYILLFFEIIWINIVLSILCLRFRDIKQIVLNLIQVAFFVSPIIWQRNSLGKYDWLGDINPVFHLLEIVRAPLLNQAFPWLSLWVLLAGLAIGFVVAELLMMRCRNRFFYWL